MRSAPALPTQTWSGEAVDRIVAKTGRDADSARAEITKTNPMGRLIAPEEVADAVCFLARREFGRHHRHGHRGGGRRSMNPLAHLDSETKVLESPHAHKDELRLWLRLLTCTNLIEAGIRKRLAEDFDTTLPRFDLLAQLERAPKGMTLGDLSRRMMVTNGNVTGLVERLVQSRPYQAVLAAERPPGADRQAHGQGSQLISAASPARMRNGSPNSSASFRPRTSTA